MSLKSRLRVVNVCRGRFSHISHVELSFKTPPLLENSVRLCQLGPEGGLKRLEEVQGSLRKQLNVQQLQESSCFCCCEVESRFYWTYIFNDHWQHLKLY